MAHLELGDRRIMLEKECVLGRHRDCGMVLKDDGASRQHARVFLLESEWWIEDLESANGTKLNGKKLAKRARIHHGDLIGIGGTSVKLVNEHTQEIRLEKVPDDMIGRSIAGYDIDGLIGRGVTGTIFTATQKALERGVAFKVMDPRLTVSDPGFPERFLGTINKAASIRHDGVVRIHECGKDQGLLWYTMELVQGDTLEQLLKRDGAMEPPLALMIIEKAADALEAVHAAGLVHGDVKPATIMLTETGHVKILDIGVVGLSATETKAVQGDAATKQVFYLAPEQARGGASDIRGDVYSLGCALFNALTGKVPFGGATFKEVVAAHEKQPVPQIAKGLGLPAKVDTVLAQMLNKNPEWRFETMAVVKTELRALRELVTPDAASEDAERAARAKIAGRAKAKVVKRQAESLQRVATGLIAVVAVAIVLATVGLPSFGAAEPVAPVAPTTAPPRATTAATTAPRPTPGVPVPVKDVWAERWAALSTRIDAAAGNGDWGAAEIAAGRFAAEIAAAAPSHPAADSVRRRAQQLEIDGGAWYLTAVAALPAAGDEAARLRELARLRDVALTINRGDAEARYQEALAKLTQRLGAARRNARQALEQGRFAELPALAQGLEAGFTGTPVAGLHRTFAAQATEAARAQPQWKSDWATTEARLKAVKGAAALPAAAALMLAGGGDSLAAARKLLADPALAQGDALRRKEALLGREAAVLSFDDPADLQFIETLQGEPRMQAGALRSEDDGGVACAVPVGGPAWSASISFALKNAAPDAEATVSCVAGSDASFVLRIGPEVVTARVATAEGMQETTVERAADGGNCRVRLSCRGGALTVLLDANGIGSWENVAIPAGSQLRCEVGGYQWAIEDLQVLSGE